MGRSDSLLSLAAQMSSVVLVGVLRSAENGRMRLLDASDAIDVLILPRLQHSVNINFLGHLSMPVLLCL